MIAGPARKTATKGKRFPMIFNNFEHLTKQEAISANIKKKIDVQSFPSCFY